MARSRLLIFFVMLVVSGCGDRDLRADHQDAVPFRSRPPTRRLDLPPPDEALRQVHAEIAELPSGGVGGGDQFSFVVVLTNRSDVPVGLKPCPVYGVTLGNDSRVTTLTSHLPCEEFGGEIGPGEERRMVVEMRATEENLGRGDALRFQMPPGSMVTQEIRSAHFPTSLQVRWAVGAAVLIVVLALTLHLRGRVSSA